MENLLEKPRLNAEIIYDMSWPTRCGVVFGIPHSGTDYPADFGYSCDLSSLQQAEDTLVDGIFYNVATSGGAGALKARFARTYVDVNRAADDIDPMMLSPVADMACNPSPRALAGHGVFHTYTKGGAIYDRPITPAAATHRLTAYYHPYHTALHSLVMHAHENFGGALLVDCHSMSPSSLACFADNMQPDIVLGDLDGTSCGIHTRRHVQKILTAMGYRVAVNVPYKGAEILRRYGNPATGVHALQIEINKAIYLENDRALKTKAFDRLCQNMDALTQEICNHKEIYQRG